MLSGSSRGGGGGIDWEPVGADDPDAGGDGTRGMVSAGFSSFSSSICGGGVVRSFCLVGSTGVSIVTAGGEGLLPDISAFVLGRDWSC